MKKVLLIIATLALIHSCDIPKSAVSIYGRDVSYIINIENALEWRGNLSIDGITRFYRMKNVGKAPLLLCTDSILVLDADGNKVNYSANINRKKNKKNEISIVDANGYVPLLPGDYVVIRFIVERKYMHKHYYIPAGCFIKTTKGTSLMNSQIELCPVPKI